MYPNKDMLRVKVETVVHGEHRQCDLVLQPYAKVDELKKEIVDTLGVSQSRSLHVVYRSALTLYAVDHVSDPLSDLDFVQHVMQDYHSSSFRM